MRDDDMARDIASGGLGLLALALGAVTILAVVRPESGQPPSGLPVAGIVGFVGGLAGLYVARARGWGRQLAVLGTAVALIGLLLWGGAIAVEALIDDAGGV